MNRLVPDYYLAFACIKERCRHNCCIGWEIDIDEESYQKYQAVTGVFGERLQEGIVTQDSTKVFRLGEGERCPFLNDRNLCDIILHLGEDHLCHICNNHPRFVNYFSDREEWGLGLCCEAAAELIIKKKEPVTFLERDGFDVEWQEPEETIFFATREEIYDMLQNRERTVAERMQAVMERWQIQLPSWGFPRWADELAKLERLDSAWEEELNRLSLVHTTLQAWTDDWELAWEQLLMYFVYRHLAESVYDGRFRERLAFSLQSVMLLQGLSANREGMTLTDLAELARQYSAEIEYSEENMEEMLSVLQQK
ncbi:MAG: flagellin lysine-N-methylase [Clostridia bacterium]|nr:flagellin lysine-N-methylase [Clostridia bacterium]